MNKLEIIDILNSIFEGREIYVEPKSKFSVIDIRGTGLRFFTYSEDSSKSDCIWYCNVWIVSDSKEVRILNEIAKEFIKEIYEHTKVLNKINDGDWITTIRQYAVDHGKSHLNGKYKILSKTVKAKNVYGNGDSIFEFGYSA